MNNLIINSAFIVNALRNCGYTNYSAIADIIDNSIEQDTRGTYVSVVTEIEGKGSDVKITAIKIIDDGTGMDKEKLVEAMSLGSNTGKTATYNLGMYGTGLKTAAFSIGKTLEVFTITNNSLIMNYAKISLAPVLNGESYFVPVEYKTYKDETSEYNNTIALIKHHNKKANSGTIIKISDIDRITNKNNFKFLNTLKYYVADIFNKFIQAKVLKFFVDNNEVIYTDFIGDSACKMGDGEFVINNIKIKYKAYKLGLNNTTDKITEEESKHILIANSKKYLTKVTQNEQGFYIYRQNRLVGKGLTLGLWTRHSSMNRFRCEIFIDGNADILFGSTFLKVITDGQKDHLNQAFKDKLSQCVMGFHNEVRREAERVAELANEDSDEIKKKKAEIYNNATSDLNKNQMLGIKRRGVNKHKNEIVNDKVIPHGPQKNPNPTRIRHEKWIDGYEERSLGRNEMRFIPEHRDNKLFIVINTDHYFYKEFYNKLNNDLKLKAAMMLACDEIAKQKINYYGSDDVKMFIDQYNEYMSDEVNKVLIFN